MCLLYTFGCCVLVVYVRRRDESTAVKRRGWGKIVRKSNSHNLYRAIHEGKTTTAAVEDDDGKVCVCVFNKSIKIEYI